MRMPKASVAFLTFAIVLTGCLVPEKFTAEIEIKPDATYSYHFQGSAVFALAAASIAGGKKLTEQDEKQLVLEAKKAEGNPIFKKMKYIGQARYDIDSVEVLRAGKTSNSVNLVSLTDNKDGTYTLKSPPLNDKDRKQLEAMNIKMDGKIEVKLPSGAQVLSHNAASTPGLFNKAYSWRVGSISDAPAIKFKLQ